LDPDEPADLTIDSLKEKMAYPLRYGYSLAGEVVAVGEGVDEADWLGKLVFSFSPHSSAVVIDVSSAMLVPEGIAPEDAVFLPSVETAVSFVQAARPNIGEKVLIVGQGLIGMLTGAVMSQLSNADTTIADVSEKRLAAASSFNSKATTWNPTSPRTRDPAFDLSVEVSGHPGGLQTAIDNTGSNGRIVIGSWYGEKPTQVKLGLKFHRSGIQLVTSQVSNIPPELTGRWDKKRRFDLTWNTIRLIKPSRLISSVSALRSEDVLAAYIRLEKGEDVTVLFRDDL
jgi:threonine dehydrogenase-like Zn-dependent dehydrogenase